MDSKCAQTIEKLEVFIQRQRSLLEHTHTDIARLHALRTEVAENPSDILSTFSLKEGPIFGLTNLCDAKLSIPPDIDWSLFKSHDPTPLQNLTIQIQQTRPQRIQPHPTQHTALSDLQLLVKNARRAILDPVLSLFDLAADPDDGDAETEDAQILDPAEARRERERQKLRELKKRKIRTTYGGLGLPPQAGVYIRRDVEDESAEVDVTLDGRVGEDGDEVSSSLRHSLPSSSARARKPTFKVTSLSHSHSRTVPVPKRQKDTEEGCTPTPLSPTSSKQAPRRNPGKLKSDTYKQAWSDAEQHLLEQLLEQIPDGEKNRWKQISRAMGGKRTPRQVASRVQKYFEKLKKFGVGVDGEG